MTNDGRGHPDTEQLYLFVNGKLDQQQSKQVESHLDKCDACLQNLDNLSKTNSDTLTKILCQHAQSVLPYNTIQGNQQLDNYYLLEELGRGGMGVVYRAYDPDLKRDVAIKIVNQYASSEYHQRLRQEAEMLASLDHPGIIKINYIGMHSEGLYMVMELLYPNGLRTLTKHHKLPYQLLAGLVKQIAETVDYAHNQGVIHRDLKPENILLAPSNNDNDPWCLLKSIFDIKDLPQLKITDFGLAKLKDTNIHLTRTGALMGTPGYMAPEQIKGGDEKVDARSDIYSLGVILYQLLSGFLPFESKNSDQILLKKVVSEEPLPLRAINSHIPEALEVICLKCLMKSPQQRYESAEALADDLDRYISYKPIQAKPINVWKRMLLWAKRNTIIASYSMFTILVYCVHLFNMLVLQIPKHTLKFHFQLTMICTFFIIFLLGIDKLSQYARYQNLSRYLLASLTNIAVFLALSADLGPDSASIYVFSLIIISSVLIKPHYSMIWLQVILSGLAYTCLVLMSLWFNVWQLPTYEDMAFFYIHILVTGILMHLIIHRIHIPSVQQK